jgi:hypothetical protein
MMRVRGGLVAVIAAAAVAPLLPPSPAHAVCSVFDRYPCAPTTCSVFRRGPCIPEIDYPIGQDLRLTIESRSPVEPDARDGDGNRSDPNDHELATIRAMFDALRACWVPPQQEQARAGMQMSVRFALKRSGEIIATPRVTYVSPGAPPEARETYLNAITAALERCTPLHLTDGLGGAVAGRPIAVRFVDNRKLEPAEKIP